MTTSSAGQSLIDVQGLTRACIDILDALEHADVFLALATEAIPTLLHSLLDIPNCGEARVQLVICRHIWRTEKGRGAWPKVCILKNCHRWALRVLAMR